MPKTCFQCRKTLSFRDSFVWEKKNVCRTCLDTLEGRPTAVQKKEEQVHKTAEAEAKAFEPGALKKSFRGWGIGLVVLGVIHLALSKYLNPSWGILIIILGIINIVLLKPELFIVNGIMLIAVGIMNLGSPVKALGVMQIVWGIQEMVKYGRYRKRMTSSQTPPPGAPPESKS